jgi:hypothetical protein
VRYGGTLLRKPVVCKQWSQNRRASTSLSNAERNGAKKTRSKHGQAEALFNDGSNDQAEVIGSV